MDIIRWRSERRCEVNEGSLFPAQTHRGSQQRCLLQDKSRGGQSSLWSRAFCRASHPEPWPSDWAKENRTPKSPQTISFTSPSCHAHLFHEFACTWVRGELGSPHPGFWQHQVMFTAMFFPRKGQQQHCNLFVCLWQGEFFILPSALEFKHSPIGKMSGFEGYLILFEKR